MSPTTPSPPSRILRHTAGHTVSQSTPSFLWFWSDSSYTGALTQSPQSRHIRAFLGCLVAANQTRKLSRTYAYWTGSTLGSDSFRCFLLFAFACYSVICSTKWSPSAKREDGYVGYVHLALSPHGWCGMVCIWLLRYSGPYTKLPILIKLRVV